MLTWLSQQPSVHWISPRVRSQLHNLIASTITQTGAVLPNSADGCAGSSPSPAHIGLGPRVSGFSCVSPP